MTRIRGYLFVAVFYLWSVFSALAMTPLLLGPRRWVTHILTWWGRGNLAILRIAGVKVEVRGAPPTGRSFMAAKHQSMFDIFAPFAWLPDACFVMRKELMRIPLFGSYARHGGMVVVDREGHAAALKKLVADTQEQLKEDRQVVLFPEGTRGKPGGTPGYKPGVAALYRELGLPVIPVATNSGVHLSSYGMLLKPGVVVFEYLEPIPAGLKRGEFMRLLEERVEAASNALIAEGI